MEDGSNTNQASRPVKTVELTCDVIQALQERGGAGVTEIASSLEISKGAAHNHLSTLRKKGYVRKDDATYRLGFRFVELGSHIKRDEIQIFEPARQELFKFAMENGEYCQLMVEHEGLGLYLEKIGSEAAIGSDYHIGEQWPLHCSAAGKAILANLDQSQVQSIIDTHGLPKLTESTITDEEELMNELEQIRTQGYSLNIEESAIGIRAVGAPLQDQDNTVLGSISVSGPLTRMKGKRFREELPEKLLETANIIEINAIYH